MWRGVASALLLWLALLGPSQAAEPRTAAYLPAPSAWLQQFRQNILPFWEEPAALGIPVGNFPTYRCNDGSVYSSQSPCSELQKAPDWISRKLDRQYVRMMSRQVYLYGVAFHLTGDPQFLDWAHAGVEYILNHAFDNTTGNIVSYFQGGRAETKDRTSQDMAYDLVGLSFYYYLTRDPSVLQPILRAEQYLRQTYFDPRLGLYKLALQGPNANRLDLVGQLDQANAYMVLTTPLLPQPYQDRWKTELAGIAKAMRERFFDRASGFFIGTLTPPAGASHRCVFDRVDTDFGHTIKGYWMLSFIGRLLHDSSLDSFAREHVAAILRRAYLEPTGSWAMQPTCDAKSGGLDRNSKWWMSAELDQAAQTFGLRDRQLLRYIPATFNFWEKHMVDHQYGEVWDEIRLSDYAPQLPKIHQWKNGFHPAERTLVGYLMASALRGEPATLYYAFRDCKLPPDLRPYYYDGTVTAHADNPQKAMPGFCRVQVTFTDVH